MTAEIVLMNRSAVALAADSAVTIRFGRNEKIYNTAEKVFELSRLSPIGLLLNNSMDYMNFPYDVIIRQFRSAQDKMFRTMEDASSEFIKFLRCRQVSVEDEHQHMRSVLSGEFLRLNATFRDKIAQAVLSSRGSRRLNIDSGAIFEALITQEIDDLKRIELDGFLQDIRINQFRERFAAVVRQVAKSSFSFLPLSEDRIGLLDEVAFRIVRARLSTETSTGLVFAGYAAESLFPSMLALEVDGCVFGEPKVWQTQNEQVDRLSQSAVIAPFAQREMVDRFVYGIDSLFEEELAKGARILARTVAGTILASGGAGSRLRRRTWDDKRVDKLVDRAVAEFSDKAVRGLASINLRDVYAIMTVMPKAELAAMAEALVSLTSMKRRMSPDAETVGGPVDVALITRGEGFVWIKRKHYFEKDQNPGFFVRHYRQARESQDG